MKKPDVKDESFLKEIFWPQINSEAEAKDALLGSGTILACLFALANLLFGILGNDILLILLGLACGVAAYGIYYKAIYFLAPLIGVIGLINSISLLYIRYLIIENGGNAGGGLFLNAIVLAVSFTTVRSAYIYFNFKSNGNWVSFLNTPRKDERSNPSSEKVKIAVPQKKVKKQDKFKEKIFDRVVLGGIVLLFAVPVFQYLVSETDNKKNNPFLDIPKLKETDLTVVEKKEMTNRYVVLVENDTDKTIKNVRAFWIPSACDAVSVDEIRDIQRNLKTKGFNPGVIDGSWGRKTKTAMQAFQKARGLSITEVIDFNTAKALNVKVASLFKSKWLDGGLGTIVEQSDRIRPYGRSFVEFYTFHEQVKRSNPGGRFCYRVTGYY